MKTHIGFAIAFLVVVTDAGAQFPGNGAQPAPGMESAIAQRFLASDTDGNGKLTKEEAKLGMPRVYAEYEKIDVQNRGYVTLPEVKSFLTASR